MQNDPLYKYAKQIVDEKSDIPADLRAKMLQEVLSGLNDTLNAELLSRLSPGGLDNFNKLLDKQPSGDDVIKFFKDNGVDINDATLIAMNKFKRAYYGVNL